MLPNRQENVGWVYSPSFYLARNLRTDETSAEFARVASVVLKVASCLQRAKNWQKKWCRVFLNTLFGLRSRPCRRLLKRRKCQQKYDWTDPTPTWFNNISQNRRGNIKVLSHNLVKCSYIRSFSWPDACFYNLFWHWQHHVISHSSFSLPDWPFSRFL